MAYRVKVYHSDGKVEDHYCEDYPRVVNGVLIVGGDGAYGNRRNFTAYPLVSIQKYEVREA